MFELDKPSELQEIISPLLKKKNLRLFLKREDQIDKFISGNKWRKLKYNFAEAKKDDVKTILTFGGAFSNHIAATASAAKKYGFKSIGIIRGDELNKNSNPTLQQAHQDGMQLIFVSREEYRKRENSDWADKLAKQYESLLVPEGGSNALALKGVEEMIDEIDIGFNFIICPVGTGGTLAGIIKSIKNDQKAIGIAALKSKEYLESSVQNLIGSTVNNQWVVNDEYTFGGYGKFDEHLIRFINNFHQKQSIPLDPIYTGKMMYGIFDLIGKNYFPTGTSIVAIHTGGLQGIAGFNTMHGSDLIQT